MLPLPDIVKENIVALGASLNSSFLVAVSGGADSTALLLAMHDALRDSARLTVAHLDHGIRPGSGEDLEAVVKLSRTLGLEAFTGRLDPGEISRERRVSGSLEAAMRKLRYRFLHETAEKTGSKWIVTGHTADDQAETILFRVERGMDWRSLEGIPGRRRKILRPLIHVLRSSTWSYCRARNIVPVTDPTNYDEGFARNRIRNRTLPELEAGFDPRISDHLRRMGRAAGHLSSAERQLLETAMPDPGARNTRLMEKDLLLTLPETLQGRMIMDFLCDVLIGFPSGNLVKNVLDFIRTGQNGDLSLPGNRKLKLSYGRVEILENDQAVKNSLPAAAAELEVPGRLAISSAGIVITAEDLPPRTPGAFPRGNTALINRKCFTGSLWVRKRLPGDRFQPVGMKSRKKIKDLLVDRKIPREIRDRIPVVLNNQGEIIWIGGVEISGKAALTGEKGEKAVRLEISDHVAADPFAA